MSIEPSLLRGTNTTLLIHVSYAKTYSKRFGPGAWSLTNREKVVTWCNIASRTLLLTWSLYVIMISITSFLLHSI